MAQTEFLDNFYMTNFLWRLSFGVILAENLEGMGWSDDLFFALPRLIEKF